MSGRRVSFRWVLVSVVLAVAVSGGSVPAAGYGLVGDGSGGLGGVSAGGSGSGEDGNVGGGGVHQPAIDALRRHVGVEFPPWAGHLVYAAV